MAGQQLSVQAVRIRVSQAERKLLGVLVNTQGSF